MKLLVAISMLSLSAPVFAQEDSTLINILLRAPSMKGYEIQNLNLCNYEFNDNLEKMRAYKVIGFSGVVLKEVLRSKSFYDPNLCSPAIQ
jgi:hypothetical protein